MAQKQKVRLQIFRCLQEQLVHFCDAKTLNLQRRMNARDITIAEILHQMAVANKPIADFAVHCVIGRASLFFAKVRGVKDP